MSFMSPVIYVMYVIKYTDHFLYTEILLLIKYFPHMSFIQSRFHAVILLYIMS